MPRFAANLTMLFQEHDFLDRFGEAARVGFRGVEFLFPYEYRTAAIAERLARHDLNLVLHNLPAGDWTAGERGIAALPERRPEFREGVARAIDAAGALGCGQVNCLAGIAPSGLGRDRLHDTLRENLAYAAAELKRAGIRLLIEPVNTRDIPGFFLTGTAQAVALIDEVGSDNLFLQYDAYHMQIMEGDLARTIEANLPRIAHVQIADNPGRHEPGTGEINHPFLFGHLDALGYRGWIGCEYRPASGTRGGLSWFAPHRA
jgi:hydroxypyruvate isomerase